MKLKQLFFIPSKIEMGSHIFCFATYNEKWAHMHATRMTDHVGLLRLERLWHGKVGTKTVRSVDLYPILAATFGGRG
jgi:hypothetical protein